MILFDILYVDVHGMHGFVLGQGSLSISDYVLKMKSFVESLSTAGQPISDRDLLMNILEGLSSEFDVVVVTITALQSTMLNFFL
ncbi:hypothetical protein Ddye_018443 [Dipteronia dyeriana]|uniref:Uncharacterized protein n=1 Tax=Dipteronia dyeriana TaxID=168575 RepID=A0AAD9X0T8_9ROSI|nr:hypothetical protein Ddye_018443 [Dipteronia dyeriana]